MEKCKEIKNEIMKETNYCKCSLRPQCRLVGRSVGQLVSWPVHHCIPNGREVTTLPCSYRSTYSDPNWIILLPRSRGIRPIQEQRKWYSLTGNQRKQQTSPVTRSTRPAHACPGAGVTVQNGEGTKVARDGLREEVEYKNVFPLHVM